MSQSFRRASVTVVLILFAVGFTASAFAQANNPPRYQVDAAWPKPLPNDWLIGQVGGLAVDKHDHIWVNQRPRTLTDDEKGAIPNPPLRTEPRSLCCKPALRCWSSMPKATCCTPGEAPRMPANVNLPRVSGRKVSTAFSWTTMTMSGCRATVSTTACC